MSRLRHRGVPDRPGEGGLAICPHCWMVNPGPFRLCSRCGASMETHLQESAGLRRTAPVQSPVPVGGGRRLTPFQRAVVGVFVLALALAYVAHLVPPQPRPAPASPTPTPSPGGQP